MLASTSITSLAYRIRYFVRHDPCLQGQQRDSGRNCRSNGRQRYRRQENAPGRQRGLQDCERRKGFGYLALAIVDVGPSHHQSGTGANDATVRGQKSAGGGPQVIDLDLGSRAGLSQQPENPLAQYRVRQRENHGLVNRAFRIEVVVPNLHAHGSAVVVEFDELSTDEILKSGSSGRQTPLSRMDFARMPGDVARRSGLPSKQGPNNPDLWTP